VHREIGKLIAVKQFESWIEIAKLDAGRWFGKEFAELSGQI